MPHPTLVAAPERTPTHRDAPATVTVEDDESYVYYTNCSAVRAAGAAPIYAGEPGYGRHLDRDSDGVGCE